MAPIFRRHEDSPAADPEVLDLLRRSHLLLVDPSAVTPEALDHLVRNRIHDCELAATGRARVGRRSAITGPYALDAAEAERVDVPAPWRTVYALEAPKERDPDGFVSFVDPVLMASWMRAFPTGPPFREEGDLLTLGLDLARRLRTGVRIAGSGVVMTPDPTRNVELTVWSPYWVEPGDLVALLAPTLPGAHQDVGRPHEEPPEVEEVPWSVDPLDPRAEQLENALTPELLTRLETVAYATDVWAAQEMAKTDGYAVVGEGGIVVGVQVETLVPPWVLRQLADLPDVPTDRLVTYDIRWWPQDLGQLYLERPSPAHRIARSMVGETIRAVALVTSEAVFGVVADAAGFHVPPEKLR